MNWTKLPLLYTTCLKAIDSFFLKKKAGNCGFHKAFYIHNTENETKKLYFFNKSNFGNGRRHLGSRLVGRREEKLSVGVKPLNDFM